MARVVPLLALCALVACPGGAEEAPVDRDGAAEAFQLGRGQQLQHAANPSQERLDAAVEHLERAARLDGTVADHHYYAGLAREGRGDEVEARAHFANAVERDGGHAAARWRLGRLLHGEARLQDAREHLERARELGVGEEQPALCVDVGRVYEDLEDLAGARELYEEALRLREAETLAHFRLAHVLRLAGDPDGATRAMDRYRELWELEQQLGAARTAARQDPRDVTAQLAVARLASELMRTSVARGACLRVLSLAPGHAEAKAILGALEARGE